MGPFGPDFLSVLRVSPFLESIHLDSLTRVAAERGGHQETDWAGLFFPGYSLSFVGPGITLVQEGSTRDVFHLVGTEGRELTCGGATGWGHFRG